MLDFLISLVILIFAAWLVRRLLGIDRGRWSVTLLAVIAAEACTIVVFRFSGLAVRDLSGRSLFGIYAIVAVFAMFAVVLVEMVARPRSGRRPRGIPHPIRGIRSAAGRTLRYLRVTSIAVRRGLLRTGGSTAEIRGTRLGHALAETFDDAGGLFVKLGQAMAAQPQLVTRTVAAELSRLQDQAAPADPAAARTVLEDELGPVDDVFDEIDTDPLGSASIAQTYRARLKGGREVVVKVQRPGVRESIEQDLDILARLADRLDRRTTWASAIGLRELVAGFAESTREELDFRIEAANSVAARRSLQDADPIRVPEVLDEFTTPRVLVEELEDGTSVGAAGALDGIDADGRRALADALLALTLRQMMAGEPFHADPHPGNVFLRTDGRLALIDFGAVGRLNRFERSGLVDMMRGLQTEEPSLLRDAALRIGTHTRRIDEEALDRELARLLAAATRADGSLNPDVFGNALFVFRDFGIVLPRSTTTLFRTLVTLVGTLQVLSPGYDLAEAARRLGATPEAQQAAPRTLEELVLQEAMNAGPALARLPREMDELARSLLRGELRTRVSLLSEPEDVRVARGLVNRMVTGLVGSAMALSSAILLTSGSSSGVGLVSVLGGIGLFFSLLLLLRLVVQILRERD